MRNTFGNIITTIYIKPDYAALKDDRVSPAISTIKTDVTDNGCSECAAAAGVIKQYNDYFSLQTGTHCLWDDELGIFICPGTFWRRIENQRWNFDIENVFNPAFTKSFHEFARENKLVGTIITYKCNPAAAFCPIDRISYFIKDLSDGNITLAYPDKKAELIQKLKETAGNC